MADRLSRLGITLTESPSTATAAAGNVREQAAAAVTTTTTEMLQGVNGTPVAALPQRTADNGRGSGGASGV